MRQRDLIAAGALGLAAAASGQTLEATLSWPQPPGLIHFGQAAAIDHDVIAVGSVGAGPTIYLNDLHIFEYDGAAWQHVLTTRGSDTIDGDYFAASVGLAGDRIVAGAGDHAADLGAAYVFKRNGSWAEEAKLGAALPARDRFGGAVAILNDTIFVSSSADTLFSHLNPSGVVRVFEQVSGEWTQIQRIISPDGLEARRFGPVAVAGRWLFISDYFWSDRRGAVYVYEHDGSSYVYRERLVPLRTDRVDFGEALAASETTLVVGAPSTEVAGHDSAGSVHCFRLMAGRWTLEKTIENPRPADTQGFGSSLAAFSDRVAVGRADSKDEKDVRVYDWQSGQWVEAFRLLSPDPDSQSRFGHRLCLNEDRLIVADPNSSAVYLGVGAVFVYRLDFTVCYPDCDEDGELTLFDWLCFGNAFAAMDPYADCDASGAFDLFDFICFQNEWFAGCP